MFPTEIVDVYKVYDHKTCCCKSMTTPRIDFSYRGKKQRKLHFPKWWYPKYQLLLQSAILAEAEGKSYISFTLKDYGVRDIRGVFAKVVGDNIQSDLEYYQVVGYDQFDCFYLDIPIDINCDVSQLSLQICGIRYLHTDSTVGVVSTPQKLFGYEKKRLAAIDKARKDTVANSEEQPTAVRRPRKLVYNDELIGDVWKLFPEISEILVSICDKTTQLEYAINSLPDNIADIGMAAPSDQDETICLPIECTFNQKFYNRICFLKSHTVTSQIISVIDFLQYQVPVVANNEPLILCVYGTHWLSPLYSKEKTVIGHDRCASVFAEVQASCKTLKLIAEIRAESADFCHEDIFRRSTVYCKYLQCQQRLEGWIANRNREISSLVKVTRPSIWTSEYRLYRYVKILCPDALYQYRTPWLEGQSIDIFIPSLGCAIEYQGKQHYEAIDYFGGEIGLSERLQNDQDKAYKCRANGISLFEWNYKDKILFSDVLSFLNLHCFKDEKGMDFVKECLESSVPFSVQELLTSDTYKQERMNGHEQQPSIAYELRRYNADGLYLDSFSNIRDAAERVSISVQQIQKVISGRAKTAAGYQWKRVICGEPYHGTDPVKKDCVQNIAKGVLQVSEQGEVVGEYDSINRAEKETGINRKSIRDVLAGRQRTAGGFCWCYKDNRQV